MKAKQPKPTKNRKTVLVVEDESFNMKLFTITLNKYGYTVLQAANGFHGYVLAHDERPDLIVMDVRMPKVSGLEVTRSLKDSIYTKDIPVLIATAFLIDEAELRESGCDAYISKPFRTSKFVGAVDSLLNEERT